MRHSFKWKFKKSKAGSFVHKHFLPKAEDLNTTKITDLNSPRFSPNIPRSLEEDVNWERQDVANEGDGFEAANRQRNAEAIHITEKEKTQLKKLN